VNFEFGLDRNIFDIALDVFCICCYSVEEAVAMETLFKEEFRLKCYEMAISGPCAYFPFYFCFMFVLLSNLIIIYLYRYDQQSEWR